MKRTAQSAYFTFKFFRPTIALTRLVPTVPYSSETAPGGPWSMNVNWMGRFIQEHNLAFEDQRLLETSTIHEVFTKGRGPWDAKIHQD